MARYLHLLLLDSSTSDYVYFEFQFQLRPTVWAIVLYINDRTPSMKAPHMAGLYVVFASDNTVQSSFIFLKWPSKLEVRVFTGAECSLCFNLFIKEAS